MSQPDDTWESCNKDQPTPVILWLDANMGDPQEYVHIKRAFGTNTDPRCETWTNLSDKDFDYLMRSETAQEVTFEGLKFLLHCFTDPDHCLTAFNDYKKNRRVFLLVSGSLGQGFVPNLVQNHENDLIDVMRRIPLKFIYVFCANKRLHIPWTINYLKYIEVFDYDQILLQRLVRDIAEYFFMRGKRLYDDDQLSDANRYLGWSKKLWLRHIALEAQFKKVTIDTIRPNPRLQEIDTLLDEISKSCSENEEGHEAS